MGIDERIDTTKGSNRDLFLKQGAELIQEELESQGDFSVELQQDIELRNVDLLSENIILNKGIHKDTKVKINNYSKNIRKILFATAHFIETENFSSVDEAINKIQLSKFDKGRIDGLVNAQKNLSFSYATLSSIIEIFRAANENILNEISGSKFSDSANKRLNKTALYLKNAIVVYELTDFVIKYLSGFQLEGIDDIKSIQKDVYFDIDQNQLADKKLENQVAKASEKLRETTLKEIEQRNAIREKIKEKWENMLGQIDGQLKSVSDAKEFVYDLKIIRDNVKNRIDILNLTATTALVENSIDVVSELAFNMQGLSLPPLDEKTACELLGLEL